MHVFDPNQCTPHAPREERLRRSPEENAEIERIASKGLAREYLETEILPPPATCYGFLLSLVGETKRSRHIGCRVAPALLDETVQSVVLRTVWRVKKMPLGSPGNTRPDYQQLLTA